MKRVLTIAGSDSSGGAGIEADLKTFTAHGCYGMTCITGLTAQNTKGVKQIYPVESQEMIKNTIEAVFDDVGVDAVKTGMLSTVETVQTVVESLKKYKPPVLIIDPVMVSTSGAELISKEAIDGYIKDLFPLATLITPNLFEAQLVAEKLGLPKTKIQSVEDMKELAKSLSSSLACNGVLLKGGHAGMDDERRITSSIRDATKIVDVLYYDGEFTIIEDKFVGTTSTHGTGCTLASAIASNIAKGDSVPYAVRKGIAYVQQAIASAFPLGSGNGPVNHLHSIDIRPFSEGKFLDYLLQHPKVVPVWDKYVNHPFPRQIATNTVDESRFRYFLIQDYLYLRHYSRAHSLAGFKAHDLEDINRSAAIVQHIRHELELHISYCKKFGLTIQDLESATENQACTAYTRYSLDIGNKEDWLALQIALSPCLFGYLQAAEKLYNDPESKRTNNPYWRWVESYVADDYVEASNLGRALLEKHVMTVSTARLEQLVDIFATVSGFEVQFWDACM